MWCDILKEPHLLSNKHKVTTMTITLNYRVISYSYDPRSAAVLLVLMGFALFSVRLETRTAYNEGLPPVGMR